jgi:ClpP class serine protease
MDNKGFDPISIFWLFIIISSLQPLLKQKMIEAARTRLIAQIERKRNSRVILIVHRQESMSFLGIPLVKYLTMEDSEDVLRAIELTDPEKDIDLVLHTPGGLVIAALQIARAIQNRKGKTRVIVPHYAMSGGTLIALASDEIIMSPNAVLGPVDPQLGEYPGPSLRKLIETKPIEKIDDKTFIMADIAEKAINQLQEALKEILSKNYTAEKAEELSKKLTEGRWTHDFPITFKFAKELGLNVKDEIPQEFMELMSMYSQPVRKQKNVEYLHYDNHQLKS